MAESPWWPSVHWRVDGWHSGVLDNKSNPSNSFRILVGSQSPPASSSCSRRRRDKLESVQSGALQALATALDAVPLHGPSSFLFEQWRMAAASLDAALTEAGSPRRSWFTALDSSTRSISNHLRNREGWLRRRANEHAAIDGVSVVNVLRTGNHRRLSRESLRGGSG